MKRAIILAALFAATSIGSASAANLRMSWWGSDDRHLATQEALKVCGAKFGHMISPEFTGWGGHQEKIATQLAGRTEPDIMQINWPWLPLFSKSGEGFADLNQFKDVIDFSQWSDSELQSGVVKGKMNGVPVSTTGRIFMFNKTIYEKAGIAVPKTWDEMFAAAPVLKAKLGNDYYPFEAAPSEGNGLNARIVVILRATQMTGKTFIDPETNKVAWTEEELAAALNFYQSMVDKGVIESWKNSSAGGNRPLFENQKWSDGRYASSYQWDSTYGKIAAPLQKGLELVPTMNLTSEGGKTEGIYRKPSMLFAISKNSKEPKAAAEIINCLLNDPEAVTILGATRGIPSSKIAIKTLTDAGKIKPVQIDAYKIVTESEGPKVSPLIEHPRITDAFDTNLEAFAYGQQSAEDTAAEIIASVDEALTGI
ncbi:carbohydrate ABC transporter substrate-binding protein [Agrobacterium larrymoorei]|uniref:ABC transporter substrate-binding protein n=1 Tax=Agrobacterium larrymoorei TaxID=160699 RepID=UPI001572556D|nr:ABC transporter substrate-binding protein [Agrobacterium larrymoorei]NTJ44342.1 carbohydrate ABC transporter substrate-binding protein [Agrobacterium larrymoorei]